MAFTWVPTNLFLPLVPWLAMLGLLMLRPNRTGSAWWIWAPLGLSLGVQVLAKTGLSFIPSQALEMFADIVNALTFGMGALWLLAGFLGWTHRFLAFLGSLAALGAGSLVTILANVGWPNGPESLGAIFVAVVGAFIMALSLTLTGWLCRRKFGTIRLLLLLLGCVLVVSLVLSLPILVFASIMSRGQAEIGAFFGGIAVFAGVCYATALPFLVLSLMNSFYRQRLERFLHVGERDAPPVIATAQAVEEVGIGVQGNA